MCYLGQFCEGVFIAIYFRQKYKRISRYLITYDAIFDSAKKNQSTFKNEISSKLQLRFSPDSSHNFGIIYSLVRCSFWYLLSIFSFIKKSVWLGWFEFLLSCVYFTYLEKLMRLVTSIEWLKTKKLGYVKLITSVPKDRYH